MRNRDAFVLSAALLAIGCEGAERPGCMPGQRASLVADVPDPVEGFHLFSHSHNDFEHHQPLDEALAAHMGSIEVDVYYGDGAFPVSHDGNDSKGTLEALYLDPLAARIAARGSVYGDGEPIVLVIDIKERDEQLPSALHGVLDRYEWLTRYTDDSVEQGTVDALLTGDAEMKAAAIDFPSRRAARDSNDYRPDDPITTDNRWLAYALDWPRYLSWDGQSVIDEPNRDALACLVANATARKRSVRLWNAPDQAEAWQTLLAAGVRFLNTDRLEALDAWLGDR